MSCTVTAPNGANANCIKYLSEAQAAIITDPSVTFASLAALDNVESIRELLQEDMTGFVLEFNGTEPTRAEATVETTGFGQNYVTAESNPSLIGYVKTNACDFNQLLSAYKGGTYNVLFFLADGSLYVAQQGITLKGFQTQVYTQRYGIPGRENQTQSFKVIFNFLKGSEFDNARTFDVNYSVDDLQLYLPLGLQADVATAFDGTDIVLNVYTRCVPDSGHSGVMTAEVVKATQGLTVTAVPVDNTDNTYTVTVQKSGPADLGVGEYAEFYLVTKSGDIYTEMSNIIKVVGIA